MGSCARWQGKDQEAQPAATFKEGDATHDAKSTMRATQSTATEGRSHRDACRRAAGGPQALGERWEWEGGAPLTAALLVEEVGAKGGHRLARQRCTNTDAGPPPPPSPRWPCPGRLPDLHHRPWIATRGQCLHHALVLP